MTLLFNHSLIAASGLAGVDADLLLSILLIVFGISWGTVQVRTAMKKDKPVEIRAAAEYVTRPELTAVENRLTKQVKDLDSDFKDMRKKLDDDARENRTLLEKMRDENRQMMSGVHDRLNLFIGSYEEQEKQICTRLDQITQNQIDFSKSSSHPTDRQPG